jgi:hypothetical protein
MFLRLALRDLGILAFSLAVWWAVSDLSAPGGAPWLADLTGFVAGGLLGLSGYLLHEWGHLLAGLAAGGRVNPARSLGSGFLFSFPAEENSLRTFVVMSLGGFAVTGLLVWSFQVFLPDGLLATRVARGASLFLLSLLLALELPLFGLALVRGSVPAAAAVPLKVPAEPHSG